MRIFKYPLTVVDPGGHVTITMPRLALPLSVQMQRGTPQLWALVDETAPTEERVFTIVGTGQPIDDRLYPGLLRRAVRFIGTFQDAGGDVWHLFDRGTSPL